MNRSTNVSELETMFADFLARHLGSFDLPADADIFAMGLVNSMFALEVIVYMEREFGISVLDEDLDLSHFRSIRSLATFVHHKLAASVSG